MYAKLAFRNIFRSRGRTFITLLVIVTGCISLILAGGFIEDTATQVRESYIRDFLGHIRIFKRGFNEQGLLHPFDYLIVDSGGLLKVLEGLPHIKEVSPRIHFAGLVSTGDTSVSFIAEAIDPAREHMMQNTSHLVSGQFFEPTSRFDVLVGKGLAKALQISVGSPLVLVANTEKGAINAVDVTVKGTFGTVDKSFDDHALRVPLSLAQQLLRTNGVESIVVFLDQTQNVSSVKEAIRAVFRERKLDYEVKAWDELEEADFPAKLVAVYKGFYRVLKLIILVVVTLGIVNTMNMTVLERIGEIGTLMAMGTRQSGIATLFLCEGFFIGLFGGTLGCLLGWILAAVISHVGIPMPTPPGTTIQWIARISVTSTALGWAFGMALITALVSSVLPALKASQLEIAQALRHNI